MMDIKNILKDTSDDVKSIKEPKWLTFYQEKINRIRQKISYIALIIDCHARKIPLTKRQINIKMRLKKWYSNTKSVTLKAKLAELKHNLKVTSEFLRNKKLVSKRNSINKRYQLNQKGIFREWKNEKIEINSVPSITEVEKLWSSLWGKKTSYNKNAKWLPTLENKYCPNITQASYTISEELFKNVLYKMKNSGAPGNVRLILWLSKT